MPFLGFHHYYTNTDVRDDVLNTNRRLNRKDQLDDLSAKVKTGNPLLIVSEQLDGMPFVEYPMRLPYLLDWAIMNGDMRYFSLDQERYLKKFFKQAGVATSKMTCPPKDSVEMDLSTAFEEMDVIMQQLDHFLGGFVGEYHD